MKRLLILTVAFLLLSGCTTIGLQDRETVKTRDFGAEESLCICIYKDVEVSDERVEEMIAGMRAEFAPFGVNIEVPWIREWKRPAFTSDGIMTDIAFRHLEPPCDRIFAMVGRNLGDFLWGMLMPEVLGGVEAITMTKGFAVVEMGSVNQFLNSTSPTKPAIHETYHFLGCDDAFTAYACYDQIARIKEAARENRESGKDFFPGMTVDGKIFWTRAEVDRQFGLNPWKPTHLTSSAP